MIQEMREALEYYAKIDEGENPKKLPKGVTVPIARSIIRYVDATIREIK
jgi:hypothetical protein